ncbi:MAG: 2-oxoacid:acceptor oxidoreductase family protein [Candidatus Korarchaeum sp.]|nr:2-oxoacid:acceptor oxidoreductase family protein [Candidatus Korarchaeum sp.]MDW8035541.1 2-oxoacid:acceptor oxidoreductase family protein [Candidatus Korarchaeum sp.]
MRIEVIISGFGGQGVVVAGAVLTQAAVLSNYYASSTYTYGPEARLGSTRSEVVISDDEVDYPKVLNPDYWIVMNQHSLNTLAPRYQFEKTIVIADSTMIKFFNPIENKAKIIYRIPATDEAEKLGDKLVTNMLMLGIFSGISGIIPPENLKEAIKSTVRPQFFEINTRAVDRGIEIAKLIAK